jgi:hypothetical protein
MFGVCRLKIYLSVVDVLSIVTAVPYLQYYLYMGEVRILLAIKRDMSAKELKNYLLCEQKLKDSDF